MQVFNIIQGWTNFVLKHKTKDARRKAEICFDCENRTYGKFESIVNDEIKEIQGFYCKECTCPLSAKLRSDSKCPLKKF